MSRLPFEQSRNDLHFKIECTCPSKLFEGSDIAHLMKTTIRCSGYDDDNFFDNVNRTPRRSKCGTCGRPYRIQWFRDGVEFAFEDEVTAP